MDSGTVTKGALPRVQWGPVVAGVLCALAAQIVLGLFGVAFGFASGPGGAGVGVLAGIWGVATPIVASFVGAFVAVRVAAEREEAGAFLHGALVWCIGLIAGALFITGSLATGAMTAGAAASGNVGLPALQRRDTPAARARVQGAGEEAAKGMAAGTGAAGVAALLGLGGALLGAAVGRRMLRGQPAVPRRSAPQAPAPRREVEQESGIAYGDGGGAVTTRPPGDHLGLPDEPGSIHHH